MPDQAPDDRSLSPAEHGELERAVSKAKLKPYGRRVLIQDPPAEEESGIILPDSAKGLKRGIITALPDPAVEQMATWFGHTVEREEKSDEVFGLSVGDVVLYPPSAGEEVNGQRLLDLESIRAVEQ